MGEDFDALFRDVTHGRHFAPPLRALLREVFDALSRRPADLVSLRRALEQLLSYLASADGRTDANCSVTDYFFSAAEQGRLDWRHLPGEWQALLGSLGGTLHDTVHAASIARTFETLPEQLLARLRALD